MAGSNTGTVYARVDGTVRQTALSKARSTYLKLRTDEHGGNRGTTLGDFKRFAVKFAALNPGCTIEDVKSAFTKDLRAMVEKARAELLESGQIREQDGKYYASDALASNYSEASGLVIAYLRANRASAVNFSSVYDYVCTNSQTINSLPPEQKNYVVSFALSDLVSSDIVRQTRQYDGRYLFQLLPGASPHSFDLFFMIRDTRALGLKEKKDVPTFFLKLLACSKGGFTSDQIERAFLFNLEDAATRSLYELTTSGILAHSENGYSFSPAFMVAYTEISGLTIKCLRENSSYPLRVNTLETTVLGRLSPGTRTNAMSDSDMHYLFLASLAEAELYDLVRLTSKVVSPGNYVLQVALNNSGIPSGLLFDD